jgi:hypothetical protein
VKPCNLPQSIASNFGRAFALLTLLVPVSLLTSCGGGSYTTSNPPPAPDFAISLSANSVSSVVGTTTSPVTVSVNGSNGFSGSVSVALTGLPSGVTSSPPSPIVIAVGSSVSLSFTAPAAASTGSIPISLTATGGSLSHGSQLTLNLTTSLMGSVDAPKPNAAVSGSFFVSGWAFEKIAVSAVEVLVDNSPIGKAIYGIARPDVAAAFPRAPTDSGYSLNLKTSALSNGAHTVTISVTDTSSNVAALPPVQITINNSPPPPTGPVVNLSLSSPTTSPVAGNIIQMTATATDASGNSVMPAFTWMSSAPSVAKVTPAGAVLALTSGSAMISVSAGGMSKSITLNIQSASGTPGTIQVSLGPEEVVFRHTTDACMDGDFPDNPARAVRLADGSLLLNAGAATFWFLSIGPDFYSLQRNCNPVMISQDDWSASSFTNRDWIFALYSDGSVIHALIHNEFHDPVAPNCLPGDSSDANPCQYNSITYASSADGGHTFTHPTSPQHLVAPPPVQWSPTPTNSIFPVAPYYGYFEPTNIVHSSDGFYYSRMIAVDNSSAPTGGYCVMRTQTLSNPASWRAWDGSGFNLQMTNPYTGPATTICQRSFLLPYESLTFNTYLNKFMLVGMSNQYTSNLPTQCGYYFSLSSDLVNWSLQQLIAPAFFPAPAACQKPGAGGIAGGVAYASIIDHDDTTINFETPGRTPYLYYTRFNDNVENRDLVRVPIIITQF